MGRLKQVRAMALVIVVAALVAAACSSSKSSGGKTSPGGPTGTNKIASVKQGGDITVSAEQEPDCMDWLGSCASAAWGIWAAQVETMPEPYTYDDAKGWIPSP